MLSANRRSHLIGEVSGCCSRPIPVQSGNPFEDGYGLTNVLAATTAQNIPTLNQTPAQVAEVLSPVLSPLDSLIKLIKLVNPWSASAWNPANWSGSPPAGRRVEHRVVADRVARSQRRRLEWRGVERRRLERCGLERSFVERRCLEWRGVERRCLEWRCLEWPRVEVAPA